MLAALAILASNVAAQAGPATEDAYFRAVREFFSVPAIEIEILRDSKLPADEIPVVLFFAERAGVSPEALVGLRRSGSDWNTLSVRYGVGADAYHVPVPESSNAGPLAALYEAYRSTPPTQWGGIRLRAEDIVVLVNVRVLAQTLGIQPAAILEQANPATTFVELYGRLIR